MLIIDIINRLENEAPTSSTLDEDLHIFEVLSKIRDCNGDALQVAAILYGEGITEESVEKFVVLNPELKERFLKMLRAGKSN